MKAIAIREAGLPEILKVTEVPSPVASPDEVLIHQFFAGVNYGDTIRRKRGLFSTNKEGYYIPGFEGVGRVIAAGKNVSDIKVGQRVVYLSENGGAYAQQVSINERFVFAVPDHISDYTAAAVTCAGVTAWQLIGLSEIRKDSCVIVHGATGGVGLLIVQLAVSKGAKVIAVVGSEAKKSFLSGYKVTAILTGESDTMEREILKLTNEQGVDVIFDCVGQQVAELNMRTLRRGGKLLYYGSASGHPVFPAQDILMKSFSIHGFNVFNFYLNRKDLQMAIEGFWEAVHHCVVRITIHKVIPMSRAAEAHRLLEDRQAIGKVLLDLS